MFLESDVVHYCCSAPKLKFLKTTDRLTPPGMIDQVWHLHVLDTQSYREDCQTLGATIEHSHNDGEFVDGKFVLYAENVFNLQRNQRYKAFYEAYRLRYAA